VAFDIKEHYAYAGFTFPAPVHDFAKAHGLQSVVHEYILPEGKSPKEIWFELMINEHSCPAGVDVMHEIITQIKALNPVIADIEYDAKDFLQVRSFLLSVLYSQKPEDLFVQLNADQGDGEIDPILQNGLYYVDMQVRNIFYQERLGVSWGWTASDETLKDIKEHFNVSSQWRLSQKKSNEIYTDMCVYAFEQACVDFEAAETAWNKVKDSRPINILSYKGAP
jgi:hypothetical protein